MKKKVILIVVVFCIVAVGLLVGKNIGKSKEDFYESNADLSFAVFSDIHTNVDKFENAVDDFYDFNPNMDALVLNGDTVNQGIEEEYDDMKKALDKNIKKLPDTVIKNMGNHEFYDYLSEIKTQDDVQKFINRYLEFSGNEKIYNDTWVKGYHFISLGSDNNKLAEANYTTGFISDEQINWLKNSIAENYEQGKPIFVFLHEPLDMHFFSINKPGVDKADEIKAILSNYPEVVLFTSHVHIKPNESEGSKEEIPFTTVNTGSINSNYVLDEGSKSGFKEDTSYSNGIYVEVINNKVIIKARDFKEHAWIYGKEILN